jgi:signal transduction histidine kinase
MAKTTAPAEVEPSIGVSRSAAGSIRRRPFFQDSLIAGALTGTSVMGVVNDLNVDLPEGAADVAAHPLDEFGIALVLAQTAPVAWRRRSPLLVLSIVTAALFLYSVLGYVRSFAAFGFLLALYTVAAYRERHTSVPVGIAAGSVVLLILGFGSEPVEPDAVVATLLLVASTWFIGDSVRIRRSEFVQLEDRATRLEREREAHTREAVAAERRIIARELHDVVAHDVSVIVTQAAAAQRLADRRPHEAIGALASIEHAGREALLEMRRLMGFLRPGGSVPGALVPQPGLSELHGLVAQVREAGVPVELRIEGEERPIPAGLDLSAYRIVQEAVTNVMKHAGHARVTIEVRYLPRELQLQIDDEGTGGATGRSLTTHPGYGHLGMRERVALFGGSLAIGPRPTGGYRVAATLPIDTELR